MTITRFFRLRACAGMLIAALCLAVMPVYASSRSTTRKAHVPAHVRRVSARRVRTKHPASGRHSSGRHSSRHHRSRRRHSAIHGQRVMDSERATEIQQALIQAHYLNGSPTGKWDAETQAAMVKYQTDNGWQSKITPDSRALIKLGLGPKQDAGEYAATPAGISEISKPPAAAPTDPIRTMAISEIPLTTSN
ncbi:MAG: peptidoglycan-binding domain-containing protein [Acidobacteriaceae bacterium]